MSTYIFLVVVIFLFTASELLLDWFTGGKDYVIAARVNYILKPLFVWGLAGGLVLIPCHTAMGQCLVSSLLQGDLGDLQHPQDMAKEVAKPWMVRPDGEQVQILAGHTQFPHTIGVHDLHQMVRLEANQEYELTANVRTSPNMHEGLLGFKGMGLAKPLQKQFGPQTDFKTVSIKFKPAQAGNYEVFISFLARDKQTSIDVDRVWLLPLSGGACPDSVPRS